MNAPVSYQLVLPPGWIRVPLDEDAVRPVARELSDRYLAELPRDDRPQLRLDFERRLTRMAAEARRIEANDLLLLAEPIGDAAIAASCIVAVASTYSERPADLATISKRLGEHAMEQGVVELSAGRAARVLRRRDPTDDDQLPSIVVDYVVPIPADNDHLMLSFSTPQTPVAEAMVGLFDAMAATLQWKHRQESSGT
jgi:hypothetical protein